MQGGDPEGHAEERGAINFLRHVQLSSLVLPSLGRSAPLITAPSSLLLCASSHSEGKAPQDLPSIT